MRRMRGALLAVTVGLLVAGAACAQALPETGATASVLARGNAGVATTNEEATGLVNPAALPLLFQMAGTALPGQHASARRASRPAVAGVGGVTDPDRSRSVTAPTPSLSAPGDAEIRLAYHPPTALSDAFDGSLFALDTSTPQVAIESRFVTVNRNFARELGVQWGPQGQWGHVTGFSVGLDSGNDMFGVNYAGGPVGGDWGIAAGYTSVSNVDFPYLAFGKTLMRNGDRSLVTGGVKLSWNGIGPAPERFTVDLGAIFATPTKVMRKPALLTFGARASDITNQYDIFPDAGFRLDFGVAIVGERVGLAVDLVDVFNGTDFPPLPQTGRRVNVGAQAAVSGDDSLIVMAGLADGEFSFGARGKIPFLKDIPYLGWVFGHRADETRVGLMVVITPRIVSSDDD